MSRHLFKKISGRIKRYKHARNDSLIRRQFDLIAESTPKLSLVQIGSNDGKTNDPFYSYIKKHSWNALLVEPIPALFERLKINHEDSANTSLENVAVSSETGQQEIFFLAPPENHALPWWHDQLGSFDKTQVLQAANSLEGAESMLSSTIVECVTLQQLFARNNISRIDILHTDVESFDFEVLKQLDFSRLKPKLVLYEHKHLSVSDRADCELLFLNEGYRLIKGACDTLALL